MNYTKLLLYLELIDKPEIILTLDEISNIIGKDFLSNYDNNFLNILYENGITFFPDFSNNRIIFYKKIK